MAYLILLIEQEEISLGFYSDKDVTVRSDDYYDDFLSSEIENSDCSKLYTDNINKILSKLKPGLKITKVFNHCISFDSATKNVNTYDLQLEIRENEFRLNLLLHNNIIFSKILLDINKSYKKYDASKTIFENLMLKFNNKKNRALIKNFGMDDINKYIIAS